MKKYFLKSFTIIELLVVMGILTALLFITIVAINPSRQFKNANDGKRQNDVNAILNAVNQYISDNDGSLPTGITATPQEIGAPTSGGKVDLCSQLVFTYSASIPTAPEKNSNDITKTSGTCPGTYSTGYGIHAITGTNRVTVYSLTADLVPTISVTR